MARVDQAQTGARSRAQQVLSLVGMRSKGESVARGRGGREAEHAASDRGDVDVGERAFFEQASTGGEPVFGGELQHVTDGPVGQDREQLLQVQLGVESDVFGGGHGAGDVRAFPR